MLSMSILGFLSAARSCPHFWLPNERIEVLLSLQSLLDPTFFLSLESTLSIIRNSEDLVGQAKDLKTHLELKELKDRPLGSLVLRQAFARLNEACATLLITSPRGLERGVLHTLLYKDVDDKDAQQQETSTSQLIADIAQEEIFVSDEGSDYLHIESEAQQSRVRAVKASSLISLLCCAIVSGESANFETLLSSLEETIADPSQMANEVLACAVLQCMAVLAKSSNAVASNLCRSLPRFLARSPSSSKTVVTAALSLTFVLKLVSRDTVITVLYSLGNLLTAGRKPDGSPMQHAIKEAHTVHHYPPTVRHRPEAGSAVSLAAVDQMNVSSDCADIILAIVTIARGFGDSKVMALALSMLIQKVGKGNTTIDLRIVTEAAFLAPESSPPEFRALLKLYTRLTQEGIKRNNEDLLSAVS